MKRLVVAAGAVLVALFLLAPVAVAAEPVSAGRVLVSTQGDVTLPAGDEAELVFVVDGNATIEGTVGTVVAINGSVELAGAQVQTVVAITSPVTVGPGTVVSGDVLTVDSPVTKVGDGEVVGDVSDMSGALIGIGAILVPALFLLWIGAALAAVAAGLLLAGVAARQVRATGEVISREPAIAILAGLAGLIVIPLTAIVLMVTVVGAPLGLGIMFGLWPTLAFLGYLVAAIWVGDWVLRRTSPGTIRERPYLASFLGVLILGAVSVVPVLNLVSAFMSIVGFGAVLVLAWRVLYRGTGVAEAVSPAPVAS